MSKSTTINFFIISYTLIVALGISIVVIKVDFDRKLRDLKIEEAMIVDHNNDLHDVIQSVLNIKQ